MTTHHFIPATDSDLNDMLQVIEVRSYEELLSSVPEDIREASSLNLPPALSEQQVATLMRHKSAENMSDAISFLGAGIYDHYVPAAVDAMLQRSEFYTAYTPYQAEVSQGTLQTIYEFQTMICELYGTDVANASVYDGSSALTEAVLLAHAETRRSDVVFAGPVNPYYRSVLESCTVGMDLQFVNADAPDGIAEPSAVRNAVSDSTACIVVQQPNFLGMIEDVAAVAEIAHAAGALLIVSADPLAMGILEAPGRQGADIVIGEGQSIGIAPQFGGPALGLFSVRDALKRRLPGRVVGRTVDSRGQQAFVLTLQTREQHIRREKATSNICTNQNLMALAATVYLSLAGPDGLKATAEACAQLAHYAADRISSIDGFSLSYSAPFLMEFVVKCPAPAVQVVDRLMDRGILAGVSLSDFGYDSDLLMVAVTERRTREDIDALADALSVFAV